ncbi:MaoC family dehydratase [Roseibium litorale]|uniref:MaoC family dehydratase n=1 Tax=Roseibium litorale TaxID=2803841 RepID=A0ABR9CKK2_9HYPH|nr:MaoC family dehydratase [Roseibium litorale]MBD8891375.1 MaoC family dehydratase [Roseibium litorale]
MIGYFEDIEEGFELPLGSHTFLAEEMIAFAKEFDPQVFHLSDGGAQGTHFGRLCASGWHTASMYMSKLVQTFQEYDETFQREGKAVAKRGPSPGFEDLRWIRPVFAGDTITYKSVVSGKTESRSRPEWGIIHAENHGTNQNGEPVFFFKSNVFLERRPAPHIAT